MRRGLVLLSVINAAALACVIGTALASPQAAKRSAAAAPAAPVGSSLVVARRSTVGFSQLQAMTPQVTQTVSFLSGATPVTNTEVGPLLQQVLTAAPTGRRASCRGATSPRPPATGYRHSRCRRMVHRSRRSVPACSRPATSAAAGTCRGRWH